MGNKAKVESWNRLTRCASAKGTGDVLACHVEQEETCYRYEAIGWMREWENFGWGTFIVGRKGYESRFRIHDPARKALNDNAVEPIDDPKKTFLQSVVGKGMTVHVFQLRGESKISLSLPNDLTDREADRLASFIKSLPL